MKRWQLLGVMLFWAVLICNAESLASGGTALAGKGKDVPGGQPAAPRPKDNPNNWSKFARNGDFMSAKLKSAEKFGYGMFVCKMQAALGPVCSTFWLYSDAPAPGCMPEIAQMWRWNEFDWEFVPYTQTTQPSYITLSEDGAPTSYGSAFKDPLDTWPNGQITPDRIEWVKDRMMTDDVVFADMQNFYNAWKRGTGAKIADGDINYQGAINTTGPGHKIGGTGNPGDLAGWERAELWTYPATAVKPFPADLDVQKSATINWWRTPKGKQSIKVSLPGFDDQTYEYVVKLPFMDGSTLKGAQTVAVLNSETFIFPDKTSAYNPYTALHTYTVVWTPTRLAYYIDAPQEGTDVSNAQPVAEYKLADYPSLALSGSQAPQGLIPWVDTSLTDELGAVSINLANYLGFRTAKNLSNAECAKDVNLQAGAGWSGYPPDQDWKGADAFFRSIKYYPLVADTLDGLHTTDFILKGSDVWGFDLADGTWDEANFPQKLTNYFYILFAQDFTQAGGGGTFPQRDSFTPKAVTFEPNMDGKAAPDKKPLMRLRACPSEANPKRNFFFVVNSMNTGVGISATNPFMFVKVTSTAGSVTSAGATTPMCFFAPPQGTSADATVDLYMSKTYHGSFPKGKVPTKPDATATLTLTTDKAGNISWKVKKDDHHIIDAYQSANPYRISIGRGNATPGS
jgi:hypothetical protein